MLVLLILNDPLEELFVIAFQHGLLANLGMGSDRAILGMKRSLNFIRTSLRRSEGLKKAKVSSALSETTITGLKLFVNVY